MTVDYTMNQLVGTVNQQASSAALLGQTGYVADIDRTASLGPGGEDTGMPVSVRYVQGSGALTPGDRVKYSSTSWGTVVEAAGAAAPRRARSGRTPSKTPTRTTR